jgi:predicted nuclease of predicted toxin-antitoxin system
VKLLVDQNISRRALRLIGEAFPGSIHVDEVGLGGTTPDAEIWKHAADNGFTILTKDSDFNNLALVNEPPPKVVWLQLGNASTTEIADTVVARKDDIERFEANEDESVLVVTASA